MTNSNDELVSRIAALEAELAELKSQLPKQEKPFVRREPMPTIDYTEGMSMSGPAMKPMVDLIDPKNVKYDPNAWARNRLSEPSGFGPPPKAMTQADKALRQREAERRKAETEIKDVGSAIERQLAATGWRNKPY